MSSATIAEILHAKNPLAFGKLIARFLEMGLLKPESARGEQVFRGSTTRGYRCRRARVVFSSGALRSGLRSLRLERGLKKDAIPSGLIPELSGFALSRRLLR